jgi:ubiquitin-protein ligase E3 C
MRRAEWDDVERMRHPGGTDTEAYLLDWATKPTAETVPYSTAGGCFLQLRLLTHFVNIKLEMDRLRLLYFGDTLNRTLQQLPSIATGDSWTLELSKLGKLLLRLVQEVVVLSKSGEPVNHAGSLMISPALDLLILLSNLIPKDMANYAVEYYSVLSGLLSHPLVSRMRLSEAVMALLRPITANTLIAYGAFATQYLTAADTGDTLGSEYLDSLNYKLLAKALTLVIEESPTKVSAAGSLLSGDKNKLLWLLAHFIFLHRRLGGSQSIAQESDYAKVVSTLLSYTAEELLSRPDSDNPLASHTYRDDPIPPFVREQIDSLRQQNSITGILSYLGRTYSNTHSVQPETSCGVVGRQHSVDGIFSDAEESSDTAKSLATYALTLLRVFPKKAEEIRLWLYRGSSELKASTGTSALEYFWLASRESLVFRQISQSHRAVLGLLKPPSAGNQMGRAAPSRFETDSWKQEWNIIFLFLEMYAFVLKYMDDEEFLSAGEVRGEGIANTDASPTRDGALPLQEVAEMTIFLKNLGFALYWHASDFTDNSPDSITLGTYLGTTNPEGAPKAPSRPRDRNLPGTQSVSIAHLKDIVTGVLRMLHERDSRRNIFSKDHWLMTSQLDLTGFIPAVVAEEEKRHEMQDEEEQEEDLFNDAELDEALDTSSGWDRPNLFRPLGRNNYGYGQSHDPQQARRLEVLKRRQEQAKRKRQLELLAPRLEILRNLPFFIPFETRVQIFRQFVYRDQLRRRNGFVDPDLWRMSIAHSSQGRAGDGRPSFQDTIGRHHAEIHRASVFDDAYRNFYDLGEELKEPIQISFIDKFDTVEAGIDGGGVTKEFLTSVTSEAFDPQAPLSMFVENDQRFLFPNPNVYNEAVESLKRLGLPITSDEFTSQLRELLKRYEFLGRIVGKCMYEGILIDINFAGFFLLKWALTGGSTSASNESAYRANINDLRDLDEELYQGIVSRFPHPSMAESGHALAAGSWTKCSGNPAPTVIGVSAAELGSTGICRSFACSLQSASIASQDSMLIV